MNEKTTEKNTTERGFSTLKVVHKAICIILVALAAFIAVCLVTKGMGTLGDGIRTILRGALSWGAVIIPIALVAQAVCFADDLESKRFGKRTAFALVSAILISCIEYAIFTWGGEAVFSPVQCFTDMNGGGFIGGTVGFALTKLIGNVGVIIAGVVALAIYSLFFFAEKAGSVGQAALNFAAAIKRGIVFISDKHHAYTEKKKQIKADAEQHQREVSSQELIDDDFFRARGEASDVKIKKLGIEENASTHGLSPLVDPSERIIEEPEIIVSEPEPIRRRRSDKPVDLSYGATESTPMVEEAPRQSEDKPKEDRLAIGLDDSADSVFTQDFDPFDFATSEKKAAKYASKVATGSAITEELDEMTIYQMKADHEPDARERRLMELERKKQEYMRRNPNYRPQPSSATTQSAPAQQTPPESVTASQTVATPVTSIPEPVHTPAVSVNESHATPVTSNQTTGSSYPSRVSRPQPIKTVEFTISKGHQSDRTPPVESQAVSMTVDKSKKTEDSPEDIAILISQRVAQANPAYARSANDLKTYTKVISDGDDELYRQLEGISTPEATTATASDVATTPAVESVQNPLTSTEESVSCATESVSIAVEESVNTEEHEIHTNAANENAEINESDVIAESDSEIEKTTVTQESAPTSVEFSIGEEGVHPAPSVQSTYQRAAGFASALVNEPIATPEPEFKPYNPPTESINPPATPEASDENKLRIERSMLTPTPEAVATVNTPLENQTSVAPVATQTSVAPASAEVDFTPVSEDSSTDSVVAASTNATEPSFVVVEEDSSEQPESEDDEEDAVDVSFDDDDDDDDDSDDGDGGDIPEDEEYDEDEGEIPPEEQNPDVIKMRGMFNCLEPIDNHPTTSMPAAEERAEVIIPVEESEDEPPFDGGVMVNTPSEATSHTVAQPQTPATALVAIDSGKKTESKNKKPDYSDYQFPSLDLLAKQTEGHDDNIQAEIQENADKLIETLASFGVTASIKGVDRGPRITRYEVVPAKGVKVSSILNLQDDIALNLAAGSIRMEAPIPGKSAVGIEIPNKTSSIVRLRDLLETPDFESAKSKTFVCIGRDVAGQPVFGDLAKMPHLLIAGATGMGKSVCINSLLISVLYKARPDEVKLIMIDPKQVEFTMYNGIPHLLVPVVSDPKQAAGALMWAVEEMERRYNLLNPLCVRNIEAYNEKVTADRSLGDPLPKIIIVIDEFADLMLQVKDPVENLVTRIAQKARAAGIHLVIGTQRPSVNVITGVIKANVPSRISCKVMSNVDSKTVLDSAGAEKLLDRGDALYAPSGSAKPHRLQCAFVADGEVESIMKYLKELSNGECYDSTVMEDIERAAQKCSKKGGGADRDDVDSDGGSGEGYLNDRQFLDAVEIAVNTRKISTSLIQRKLSIGYGKAAKFIDIMEDIGVVGEANGQRPREVLMTPDEWRESLARRTIN